MTNPVVLHVAGPSLGGMGQHVISLVRLLPEEGFESVLAAGRLPPGSAREPDHRIDLAGARSALIAVARLRRIVSRIRPAIVHAQGLKAAGAATLARGRARLVVTVHNAPGSSRRAPPGAARAALRAADVVIAVSDELARSLPSSLPTRVVPLAIPAARATPSRPRSDVRRELGEGPIVLTLARLEPQKDLEVLLASARLVAPRVPGARFLIAGSGPQEASLRRRASELGLDDVVAFLGYREDATDLLAAADVLALSSRWEGVPFSVLEAAALGVPVVATRVGGLPEIIQDGVSGSLVPPRDPAALAAAIERVLTDPARAQAMAELARSRLASRPDERACVREIAQIYRDLLRLNP